MSGRPICKLLMTLPSSHHFANHSRYYEVLDYHRGACEGQANDVPTTKVNLNNLSKEMMMETY